jgi:hypothetical protein
LSQLQKRKCNADYTSYFFGWRIFFYSNEGNEPIHVHCKKGDRECKFWLGAETFDLEEAFSDNMTVRDKREIKKIIFEHFDYIIVQWEECKRRSA